MQTDEMDDIVDPAASAKAVKLDEAAAIPAHDEYRPDIAAQIGETIAWRLHQQFKWDTVARLDQDAGWTLTDAEIRDWLAPRLPEIEREHRVRRVLALIGHRVQLADSRVAEVMDVMGDADGGDDLRLVVIIPGVDDWQRVAPESVAQDLGELPDDVDDEE